MKLTIWATSRLTLNGVALAVLFSLVALIAYYRMQAYLMVPFSALSRLALYGVLFVLMIILHKGYRQLPIGMLALLASVLITAAHTAMLAGIEMAFHATARFVNVMLLAPFVALLFTGQRNIERVLWIFWMVFVCAFSSLLVQYWGWSLNTLVDGYVAIRGDLIRHMTIVGEPNVGGMLAVIVFVSSVMLVKSRGVSVLMGSLAVAFIFFSISKAAMLGMAIAVMASFWIIPRDELKESVLRTAMAGLMGLLLLHLLGAEDYARVSLESVLGSIRGEPSALEDFQSRQSRIDILSFFDRSLLPAPFSYFLGISFADVGSAALEIRGSKSDVILPHNSYLELLLTGGVLMLAIVLFLMVRAYRALWRAKRLEHGSVDRCVLICLVVLSCWLLVYPVIYEPVTGCLFWIIVGYGNRMHANPCKTLPEN